MSTINGIGTRFHGCSEVRRWLVPLMGMYSTTTFKAKPSGLYLPHVAKVYDIYLAIYLALVVVDWFDTGVWRFS